MGLWIHSTLVSYILVSYCKNIVGPKIITQVNYSEKPKCEVRSLTSESLNYYFVSQLYML